MIPSSPAAAGREATDDAAAARALVRRDVARARRLAARAEPRGSSPTTAAGRRGRLSSIERTVPRRPRHRRPIVPVRHGQALADEVPGARLLPLDGAGHGVDRADWDVLVRAILEHTGLAEARR